MDMVDEANPLPHRAGPNQAQFVEKTELVAAVGRPGCPLIRFPEPLDKAKTLAVAKDPYACKARRGKRRLGSSWRSGLLRAAEPGAKANRRSALDRDDAAAAAKRPVTELEPSRADRGLC